MAKSGASGFTLLELAIVLGAALVALYAAAPAINGYMQRYQLRLIAAQITAQIQSAKSMAASTECRSQLNLTQSGSDIRVDLELHLDNQWKGCRRWFESKGAAGANQFGLTSQSIRNVTLGNNVRLEFQGVSGSLNTTQSRAFRLYSGGKTMSITLDGIGNGVYSRVDN